MGGDPTESLEQAEEPVESTVSYWRDWLSTGTFPDHPWRSYMERSALTLKGLSYAPTGAIMAAPTTSLPETPGGARNWDYRYTWIATRRSCCGRSTASDSSGRHSSTSPSSSRR